MSEDRPTKTYEIKKLAKRLGMNVMDFPLSQEEIELPLLEDIANRLRTLEETIAQDLIELREERKAIERKMEAYG